MKGFKYLPNSKNFIECMNLEDEVCNNGPLVWTQLYAFDCPKPCKINSYKGSDIEYSFHNSTPDEASFWFEAGPVKTVGKELLVYDTNDMIGSIGGSLGLFLGFSFFGIFSLFIDKLLGFWIKIKQNNGIPFIYHP